MRVVRFEPFVEPEIEAVADVSVVDLVPDARVDVFGAGDVPSEGVFHELRHVPGPRVVMPHHRLDPFAVQQLALQVDRQHFTELADPSPVGVTDVGDHRVRLPSGQLADGLA